MSHIVDEADAVAVAEDSNAKKKSPKRYDAIADVPNKPAVYALCSRRGTDLKVAYVGETADLRKRLRQHLVTRDSGITGSERAVSMNPDAITIVYWWQDPTFRQDVAREAAELIATRHLNPIMRSDNAVSTAARDKAEQDAAFGQSMADKFHLDAPTGILTLRTLDDLSARTDELLALVSKLEQRIEKLEKALARQK